MSNVNQCPEIQAPSSLPSKLNFCFWLLTAHPPSCTAVHQDGYFDDPSKMLSVVPHAGYGLKGIC